MFSTKFIDFSWNWIDTAPESELQRIFFYVDGIDEEGEKDKNIYNYFEVIDYLKENTDINIFDKTPAKIISCFYKMLESENKGITAFYSSSEESFTGDETLRIAEFTWMV